VGYNQYKSTVQLVAGTIALLKMFLYFKRAASYQCSSKLTSMSWRQASEGGWLITGNRLGGLGVTSVGQKCELESKLGTANLFGHISEVSDNEVFRLLVTIHMVTIGEACTMETY